MNRKQQLLTNLIAKIKQPKTSAEELISGLSELENETKKIVHTASIKNMLNKFR